MQRKHVYLCKRDKNWNAYLFLNIFQRIDNIIISSSVGKSVSLPRSTKYWNDAITPMVVYDIDLIITIIIISVFIAADTKENTALLLLNAIYFKGYWTYPFDEMLTKEGIFYLNPESTISVPMMTTLNNFKIATLESLNSRLISLPYQVKCDCFCTSNIGICNICNTIIQGDKFVMYILLPNSVDGLNDLVNQINPVTLGDSIKTMQSYMIKVILPKFNFEYTSVLGPVLQTVSWIFEY